jgi:hypothetical protein
MNIHLRRFSTYLHTRSVEGKLVHVYRFVFLHFVAPHFELEQSLRRFTTCTRSVEDTLSKYI